MKKKFTFLFLSILLSSCSVTSNSIDSTSEAIDIYCQGFNYPYESGAKEKKLAALKYLRNAKEEIAQGFAIIAEKAVAGQGDFESLMLVAEVCSSRD